MSPLLFIHQDIKVDLLEVKFKDYCLSRSDMWRFTNTLVGNISTSYSVCVFLYSLHAYSTVCVCLYCVRVPVLCACACTVCMCLYCVCVPVRSGCLYCVRAPVLCVCACTVSVPVLCVCACTVCLCPYCVFVLVILLRTTNLLRYSKHLYFRPICLPFIRNCNLHFCSALLLPLSICMLYFHHTQIDTCVYVSKKLLFGDSVRYNT